MKKFPNTIPEKDAANKITVKPINILINKEDSIIIVKKSLGYKQQLSGFSGL